jgi:two-component system NarL family sensor kinase
MKHLYFSLLLLLLCYPFATSGQDKIDTLEINHQTEKNDSIKVQLLLELSRGLSGANKSKQLEYINKAMSLAKASENAILLALTYRSLGIALLENGDFKTSIENYQQALFNLSNKNDRFAESLRNKIRNDIGNSYSAEGNRSAALFQYFTAIKSLEENDSLSSDLPIIYNNIALVYSYGTQYQKSLEYLKKGVLIAEKIKSKRFLSKLYIGISFTLIKSKADLNLAYEYNERAYELAQSEKPRNLLTFADYEFNMALYYFEKANYDYALAHCKKGLALSKEFGALYAFGEFYLLQGEISFEEGNKIEALVFFNKSYIIACQTKNFTLKSKSLKRLAEVNKIIRHKDESLEYYSKFVFLADSLMSVDKNSQIFEVESRINADKKQEVINSLQNEKHIQRETMKQRNLFYYILIGSLLSFIAISVLIFLNLRNKQKIMTQDSELQKQKIFELEKDQEIIAVKAMLKGQEEERSRLAKDMHDGLGSILATVKYSLQSLEALLNMTNDTKKAFDKSVDLIEYSLHELRRVAHNMMPELLVQYGLDECLRDFCESINSDDLKITYLSFYAKDRFESSKEITVYRIFQELLTNALKHSKATQILVQLSREENLVTLTVEDNGEGFDPSMLKNSKGAGWININNRTEFLKGKIHLTSQVNSGTSISIDFYV